jgi:hypothetical protein
LEEHPEVRTAAVLAIQKSYLDQAIVAFVTIREQSADVPDRLEGFLRTSLPANMVPSRVHVLDAFPIGSTGKLDRNALAAIAENGRRVDAEPAPELDPMGREIQSMFAEILALGDVPPAASFFSLGGNSLQAIVLLRKVREAGFEIELSEFLSNQSVVSLSGLLAGRLRCESAAPLGGLDPEGSEVLEWQATSMQSLMIREYAASPSACLRYHFVQMSEFELPDFDLAVFREALAEVVSANPNFRISFKTRQEGLFCVLGKNPRRDATLAVVELSDYPHAEKEALRESIFQREKTIRFDPMDPGSPLFRFTLLRESPGKITVIYALHHAIIDGWSNIEFANAMIREYVRRKAGDTAELSRLDPEVPDLALLADLEAQAAKNEGQRSAWRLSLPQWGDLRASEVAAGIGEPASMQEMEITADPGFRLKIDAMARKAGYFLKTPWMWAWMRSIADLYAGDRPLVWAVTSARFPSMADPLRALGLFWTFRPIAVPMGGVPNPGEMREVQSGLARAEANSAYPLDALVRESGGNVSRQASFNYVHFRNILDVAHLDGNAKALGGRSYDMFHFPLNLIVRINPHSGSASLRVTWDPVEFRRNAVLERLQTVLRLLETLA